ncbi:MAG TPA: hypothetical protein VMB34_14640 [Acetobacteraceae bacterium]|nr:hypothetical protein [Acetobacteraceae bacterium]
MTFIPRDPVCFSAGGRMAPAAAMSLTLSANVTGIADYAQYGLSRPVPRTYLAVFQE